MTKVYIDYNQIILSYIFKYTDIYTPRNNPHLERLLPYIYFSDNSDPFKNEECKKFYKINDDTGQICTNIFFVLNVS